MPILKSLPRKSGNQAHLIHYLVRYSAKERKYEQDKDEAKIILRHNIRSAAKNLTGIIAEFKTNESFRLYKRKDSVILYHDILSFSAQSSIFIDDKTLQAFAKKYAQLRAPTSLALIVRHTGKTGHSHLHAVVSGVQLNGRSSRVSKAQFARIKNELEKFREQFPELEHSAVEHGKQGRQQTVERFKKTRQHTKAAILETLEKSFTEARSHDDFIDRLKGKQYEPYYRSGILQGIISRGQKYRFTGLGFNTEKLNTIEERHRQETVLQEIGRIRNKGKEHTKEAEMKKEEQVKDTVESTDILTKLTNLRGRFMQRELANHSLEPER